MKKGPFQRERTGRKKRMREIRGPFRISSFFHFILRDLWCLCGVFLFSGTCRTLADKTPFALRLWTEKPVLGKLRFLKQ
ncbi:MAG: hypothetical protein D6679_00475 [Candidatus Hydrogenedentota bacterium]|nr:MAG: hypothetical protein D6679_00475 [Candidatus Hydrogenedentota bacterium]